MQAFADTSYMFYCIPVPWYCTTWLACLLCMWSNYGWAGTSQTILIVMCWMRLPRLQAHLADNWYSTACCRP